ncbi:MAG: hypothetical protein ABEJ22_06975 [Haloferacaceae archaeon]
MTLASDARDAVREHPFLLAALRAGVVNYRAAATFLDLDGDDDAVATALRRYATDLPGYETESRSVRVSMQSGIARTDDPTDALLSVGEAAFGAGGGSLTALVANGDVDARSLAASLARLDAVGVTVEAAAVGDDALVVVVSRRDGPTALRVVESAASAVPESP